MNRREWLQERYEDALFALLMEEIAAMEEKEAEEENARLESDPSAAVPEDIDRRCVQTIRRGFARQKAYTAGRFTWKAMKGVMMAAGIAALLFTGAFAASEDVRVNTIHMVVEVFEGGRTFRFEDPAQESPAPVETEQATEAKPSEAQESDLLGVQTQEPEPSSAPPTTYVASDFRITDGVLDRYNGPGGDVVIPNWVTVIGHNAFSNCESLTSVTIPDSVTEIGNCAFLYCTGLRAVTIPDSVTRIRGRAFEYCTSLTSVTIPKGVTSIEGGLFGSCRSLTSVTIPTGVTRIENDAFSNCTSLKSVAIPEGVTKIEKQAFYECTSLTDVTIPDGVTCIEDYAFSGCHSLTDVTIPASVTSIGYHAFSYCTSLKSVTIPEGVTSIGDYAFTVCPRLTAVTLPDSVTGIGDGVFAECGGLTSVTLPKGAGRIGDYAFWKCAGLTGDIVIPDGVTYIGKGAFGNCGGLNSVTIPARTAIIREGAFDGCTALTAFRGAEGSYAQLWAMDNGLPFEAALPPAATPGIAAFDPSDFRISGGVLEKYTGPGGDVVIPEGLTYIGEAAFSGCGNLTGVTIPSSVTGIGREAFNNCGLTEVVIPEGVTVIEDFAFHGCKSLTDVTIPDSVTGIGEYVFTNCGSLMSVTVPAGVTSIGDGAFWGCESLTSITVADGNANYVSEDGVLFDRDKRTLIRCPERKAGVYVIPDSVTEIGMEAFDFCGSLTAVIIPDSVTDIGRSAFGDCVGLTAVTIPDSVTRMGKYAFASCDGLKSVTIPSGVTSLEEMVFGYCKSLKSVTIPDSVTNIAWRAFGDCTSLTTVYGTEGSYAQTWAEDRRYTFRPVLARAATQSVLVDGTPVELQAYALKDGDGNFTNYVKLRDVAFVLSGTPAQFNVTWDGEVNMETGKTYTPNGSEMTTPFSGDRTYQEDAVPAKVNGIPTALALDAILLTDDQGGAYTYYKLRDLGRALDFNVGWSSGEGIFLETDKPYDFD